MGEITATEYSVVALSFRVIVGLVFAAHGWAKRFSGGGIEGTAGWFDSIGFKPGKLHANLASTTEMAAGIALAFGFLTPLAAAAMVGVMIVAGYTSHRKNGFFIVKDGWEYTFMVSVMALAVAGFGAGKWSVDHALGLTDDWNGYQGLAVALVVGAVAGIGQLVVFYRPPKEQS